MEVRRHRSPQVLKAVLVFCCLAVPAAHAQYPAAPIGKERAAASRLEWEVGEAGHPVLGNVRFAFIKKLVETPVGSSKVFSRAYLSCQMATRRFAIELTNTTGPNDPGGLRPEAPARLTCNRLADGSTEKLVPETLLANWEVNDIGDAMARGFRAFPLRECVSIGVVQDVALPKGWAQKSARVEFEILPYNREVDSIFAACGEVSAYAAVAQKVDPLPSPLPGEREPLAAKPVVTPPPPKPSPPQAAPKVAVASPAAWQTARTISSGRTNLRASPDIKSPVVGEIAPGAVVLVQKTGSEWWRAKATKGPGVEGYIRQDRLLFK